MLELFFTGYLNNICKEFYVYHDLCNECKEKAIQKVIEKDDGGEKKVINDPYYAFDDADDACSECNREDNKLYLPYITYSGGDDLLIIGPWDCIIELAEKIRKDFKEFTCENPRINISAGISVVDSHYPVARTVKLAENNLELAKSHFKTKNSIALFNECICWDNGVLGDRRKGFEKIFEVTKKLEKEVENKNISKGFLYSLAKMWLGTFGDLKTLKNIEEFRGCGIHERKGYMPYLKYKLIRSIKKQEIRLDIEQNIKPIMPWIRVPVSWVSLRLRK